MITVYKTPNGFAVHGHAGYAEMGKDIVCAGVSALAQAVTLALKSISTYDVHEFQKDGVLDVWVGGFDTEAEFIMLPLFIGAEQLSKQYPEHVQYTVSHF